MELQKSLKTSEPNMNLGPLKKIKKFRYADVFRNQKGKKKTHKQLLAVATVQNYISSAEVKMIHWKP